MSVIKAVVDHDGVTHAVVLAPDYCLAGCTACNVRFWTTRLGTPGVFITGRDKRMAEVDADIDCMSCLVGLPAYEQEPVQRN